MAWPLTGSALTKYNRLLSDLRQYGDFIFVGAPDDITWLQEIIVAASDGELRPSLDDVANRSHFWMLELSRVLGEKVVEPAPCPECPECPPVVPCPPCPPCPDPLVTTTPSGMESELGIFSVSDIPGLTDVVFFGIGGGVDFQQQTGLINLSAPDLIILDNSDYIRANDNLALSSISLPVLTTITNSSFIEVFNNPALASFSLPALTTVDSGALLQIYDNPALTSVSLGSVIFGDGTIVFSSGNALTDVSVNHILARGVASALYVSGTVDLSGGTSSAPTGQGIADKATLIGRGVTVNTN